MFRWEEILELIENGAVDFEFFGDFLRGSLPVARLSRRGPGDIP